MQFFLIQHIFLQGLLNPAKVYIRVFCAVTPLAAAGDKKKEELNLKPLLIPFMYLANTY